MRQIFDNQMNLKHAQQYEIFGKWPNIRAEYPLKGQQQNTT